MDKRIEAAIINTVADKLADRLASELGLVRRNPVVTDATDIETGAGTRDMSPEPEPVAIKRPVKRTGRTRATTGRAAWRLTKPTKAGAALLKSGLAPRLVPVYGALRHAGKTGANMIDLESATKRTTKQIENDIMWLRSNGLAETIY